MSQGALFAFGCCIFMIVLTGGFLYGMARVSEAFERDK
jgi:hypothetical protein